MSVITAAAAAAHGVDAFRQAARDALLTAVAATSWIPATPTDEPEIGRARLLAVDRELHRQGWSGLTIDARYGGQGCTLGEHIVFLEEANALGVPTPYNRVALGIVSPALTIFGTDEQKQTHLPALIACDEIWCQGFSEPEAGSDLAALRTRATRDDVGWRVSGHKIWTTLGTAADLCFLLARTGPAEARHGAITAFILPMRVPGVTVEPIVQINGEADFAEVFLDEVHLDDDAVLGEVDGGWRVAMTALGYERSVHLLQRQLRLEQLLRDMGDPALDTSQVADGLLDLRIDALAMHHSVADQVAEMTAGRDTGVAGNATKVLWSETYQALCRLRLELSMAGSGEVAAWTTEYYTSLAASIYAGTNEVQRNIIGERGLGLPR
jgi:alkylation response protein AidB-like acyl-CoA dehydrogenase